MSFNSPVNKRLTPGQHPTKQPDHFLSLEHPYIKIVVLPPFEKFFLQTPRCVESAAQLLRQVSSSTELAIDRRPNDNYTPPHPISFLFVRTVHTTPRSYDRGASFDRKAHSDTPLFSDVYIGISISLSTLFTPSVTPPPFYFSYTLFCYL